jgi:hypothetical protein
MRVIGRPLDRPRGKGVARAVLRKLEATARDAGLLLLRLETNRALRTRRFRQLGRSRHARNGRIG